MKKSTIIQFGLFLLFFVYSCKKNSSVDLGPNVNSSNDVILAASSYTTIFNLLIKARLNPSLATYGTAFIDNSIVTYDSSTLEYDFSFMGAMSPDSIQRTGMIRMLLSGDIFRKGSFARIFFQNYCEDAGLVEGADSVSNMGVNSLHQLVFIENVIHGSIRKALKGETLAVNLNASLSTPYSSLTYGNDVIFLESGSLSGVSSKGHPFSALIRDTLVDQFSCPWIKGGIIDINVADAEVTKGYIDFSNNDGCSDVICYYFNDNVFKIRKNKYWLKN